MTELLVSLLLTSVLLLAGFQVTTSQSRAGLDASLKIKMHKDAEQALRVMTYDVRRSGSRPLKDAPDFEPVTGEFYKYGVNPELADDFTIFELYSRNDLTAASWPGKPGDSVRYSLEAKDADGLRDDLVRVDSIVGEMVLVRNIAYLEIEYIAPDDTEFVDTDPPSNHLKVRFTPDGSTEGRPSFDAGEHDRIIGMRFSIAFKDPSAPVTREEVFSSGYVRKWVRS